MAAHAIYTDAVVHHHRHAILQRIISFCILCPLMFAAVFTLLPISSYATDAPGADFSNCPQNGSSESDGDARQLCGIKNEQLNGKPVGDSNSSYNSVFNGGYQNILVDDTSNAGLADAWMQVLYRTMNPTYYLNSSISTDGSQLNKQDSSVHAWKPNRYCASLDRADDYTNDNCDVPGITTQAVQAVFRLILPSAISGGNKVSAKSPFNIGIPTSLIPGGSVPVGAGSNEYTGLEKFGYNLNWTTYNGEWDDVQVETASRMTSDMSIADDVSAAFSSLSSGITKSIGNATADVSSAWTSGNLLDIAGSILSWPFSVVFDSATNSVYNFTELMMNGYEKNIFDSNAWSRNSYYNDTAYNIRVMSDVEKSKVYLAIVQMLVQTDEAGIASRYHVDVNTIASESAFPASGPKTATPKTTTDGSGKRVPTETQAQAETRVWDTWVSANRDRLSWGKSNLNIDYSSYAPSGGTSASDTYKSLESAWNTAAVPWRAAETQTKLNENMSSFVQAMEGVDSEERASSATAKAEAKKLVANDSIFWVCTNDDGSSQGSSTNPTIRLAIQGGLRDPGQSAFDANGNYQCRDGNGRIGSIRPPISGALFGQQGTSAQKTAHHDTRHDVSATLFSLIGNPLTSMGGFFLGVSQKVAMLINYLVGLSFEPILTQLGIKSIVINVVNTLKNTLYIQLLVIVAVIAVVVIFIKILRGHALEGVKSIIILFMTIILGVILLASPNTAFKLVDDYPSMVERMVTALVLQANSNSTTEQLCRSTASATKSIDGSRYRDVNGDAIGFNADTTVRMVECNIWDAYVFEPWSLGQFGTGYSHLYVQGYVPPSTSSSDTNGSIAMNASTEKLVGDGGVDMGGGVTIHNWALYQLSKEVAGTSTTDDTSQTTGAVDKNLYRLVDLQAGVDNASGKDTSHWNWWKGNNQRLLIGFLALAASVGGLCSIGMFAIAKIEATVVMAILLAIAPIMLLIGIVPGAGRNKMKSWGFKIIALAFKRMVLVALLSVQLVVLTSVAQSNQSSVFATMLFMTAMSIIIAMYGRSIIRAFTDPIENMGGNGSFMDIDERAKQEFKQGRFMTNLRSTRMSFTNVAGSLVGSAVVGGFAGQNSSRAIFSRYEYSQRKHFNEVHQKGMDKIQNERQGLMDAYDNGTITGNEYDQRQGELNTRASRLNTEYNANISHIDDYEHNFAERRQILDDPANHVESEGMEQFHRTFNRMWSQGLRRNWRNGITDPFRDSMRAVGEEKKEQISDAYHVIMDENPEIAAALLGVGSRRDMHTLQSTLPDVDFRDAQDQLHLRAGMSADEVLDEMDDLGITYTRNAKGEYTPVLPREMVDDARRAVADAARKNDIRHGNVSGSNEGNTVNRIFRKNDAIEKRRAEAIDIAQAYLPKDQRQNRDAHVDMDKEAMGFGSLYDHNIKNPATGRTINDAASKNELLNQRDYDVVIDNQLERDRRDIEYNTSMSQEDKSRAIHAAEKKASQDRSRSVPTTDTLIAIASENARNEIMKIEDNNRNMSFEQDGKSGIWSARPKANGHDKPSASELTAAAAKVNTGYRDIVGMGTYMGLTGNLSQPKNGKSSILAAAQQDINRNIDNVKNDVAEEKPTRASSSAATPRPRKVKLQKKKTYGTKFNNPLRPVDNESAFDGAIQGTTITGSKLTTERTARQDSQEQQDEEDRGFNEKYNAEHFEHTAYAETLDIQRTHEKMQEGIDSKKVDLSPTRAKTVTSHKKPNPPTPAASPQQ